MRAARPFALNTAATEALLVHTGQPPFRASLTALMARQAMEKTDAQDVPRSRPSGRPGWVRHRARK